MTGRRRSLSSWVALLKCRQDFDCQWCRDWQWEEGSSGKEKSRVFISWLFSGCRASKQAKVNRYEGRHANVSRNFSESHCPVASAPSLSSSPCLAYLLSRSGDCPRTCSPGSPGRAPKDASTSTSASHRQLERRHLQITTSQTSHISTNKADRRQFDLPCCSLRCVLCSHPETTERNCRSDQPCYLMRSRARARPGLSTRTSTATEE